jgi:DNA-binding NtrC family response regulator
MTVSLPSTRTITCLIASHREPLAEALASALRSQGHEPVVRGTAAGAGQAMTSPGIDAVIIDGALPGVRWDRVQAALVESERDPETLEAVEKRHIAAMLRHTGGNRRNAAGLLGIARSTLLAKIRKYELDRGPSDRA